MGRKRTNLSRKHGFKKHHQHSPKRKLDVTPKTQGRNKTYVSMHGGSGVKYSRLTKKSFDSRISTNTNGVLTFKDVDGSTTDVKPLRPISIEPPLIDEYQSCSSSGQHPDLLTYKLYRLVDLQVMFNTEIKQHVQLRPHCEGDLVFDAANSRKWGLCWTERLRCEKCSYLSKYYKLYEEAESSKRGRKAAKANIASQAGLQTTSISNTALSRVLVQTNVIPPNIRNMQYHANRVSSQVVDASRKSMRQIREKILTDNKKCGNINPKLIRGESDKRYNNPLFKSGDTPFQGGTQSVHLICENNTRKKYIIGCATENKLCVIGSRLRNQGMNVVCPHHAGVCTKTLAEAESIGDEARSSQAATREINDTLELSHLTSDGDSRAHKGVEKCQGSRVVSLRDLRHLSKTMVRSINNAQFSKNMFYGVNCSNLKNRFALSVSGRCVAELRQAHLKYAGDLKQIQLVMPDIVDTVVFCFNGYCGTQCARYSLVCKGEGKQTKLYLPESVKIRMTEDDEDTLTRCIEVLLGPQNLGLTRFLTTTQKVESVNKALQASNPKMVTYSRNFEGRVHAQVMKQNLGFADSVALTGETLGTRLIKGSSVIKHVVSIDRHQKCQKSKGRVARAKLQRYNTRRQKYDLHSEIHYSKGLSNPKADLSTVPALHEHQYAVPGTSACT